jgi:hypothetical protein
MAPYRRVCSTRAQTQASSSAGRLVTTNDGQADSYAAKPGGPVYGAMLGLKGMTASCRCVGSNTGNAL